MSTTASRRAVTSAAWAVPYVAVALVLSAAQPDVGPVPWYPAVAVGVALLVVHGRRWWPLVAVVELVAAVVQYGGSVVPAVVATVAVVVEVVVIATLLGWLPFRRQFRSLDDVLGLVVAATVGGAIGAGLGATALTATDFDGGGWRDLAQRWAVGDLTGVVVVLPFLLLVLTGSDSLRDRAGQLGRVALAELALLLTGGLALTALVFFAVGRAEPGIGLRVPLVLVLLPVLLVAVRFGRLRTTFYGIAIDVVALLAFAMGRRPLGVSSDDLVGLQVFLGVVALAGLIVAVAVHAERAARSTERALLDASPVAIVVLDRERRVEVWNRAAEEVFGWRAEEVMGRVPPIVADEDADAFVQRAVRQLVEPTAMMQRYCRRDGTLFDARLTTAPMRDGSGVVVGSVGIVEDVSRERSLEADLAREQLERREVAAVTAAAAPGADAVETAGSLCRAVVGLEGIDWAGVMRPLTDGRLVTVASSTSQATVLQAPLGRATSALLVERSATGPWVIDWREPPTEGPIEAAVSATGANAVGLAPIFRGDEVAALVFCGTTHPGGATWLQRRMGAVAEVSAHAAGLLGRQLAELQDRDAVRARVADVVAHCRLHPVFQPIIDLHGGDVVGYEALTRFEDGGRPDLVIAEAHAVGLGFELEAACLSAALEDARSLPAGAWLSLNVTPSMVLGAPWATLVADAGRPVVLEITEHEQVQDYAELRRVLTAAPDVRVSVDDAGAGYASLSHILELQPDVVKLDIGLVRGIEADPARQAMVAGMRHFAAETRTDLLAEGVETEEEADALRRLGVELGQGYLFGRPAPIEPRSAPARGRAPSSGSPVR